MKLNKYKFQNGLIKI